MLVVFISSYTGVRVLDYHILHTNIHALWHCTLYLVFFTIKAPSDSGSGLGLGYCCRETTGTWGPPFGRACKKITAQKFSFIHPFVCTFMSPWNLQARQGRCVFACMSGHLWWSYKSEYFITKFIVWIVEHPTAESGPDCRAPTPSGCSLVEWNKFFGSSSCCWSRAFFDFSSNTSSGTTLLCICKICLERFLWKGHNMRHLAHEIEYCVLF